MKVFKIKGSMFRAEDLDSAKEVSKLLPLANSLQEVLECTREMEAYARSCHWNIEGKSFTRLHKLFNDEYDALVGDIDSIAENIKQLGFYVANNPLPGSKISNCENVQLNEYVNRLSCNLNLLYKVNEEATKVNHLQTIDLCGELTRKRSKTKMFIDALLKGSEEVSSITAATDIQEYKEVTDKPTFFRKLKAECDIRPKLYGNINRGLRIALKSLDEQYGDQIGVRFFIKKNAGGYIRVELGTEVYIIAYDVTDKNVKVFTKHLKRAIPVNTFDFNMLNLLSQPAGSRVPVGFMTTWLKV